MPPSIFTIIGSKIIFGTKCRPFLQINYIMQLESVDKILVLPPKFLAMEQLANVFARDHEGIEN